MLTVDQKRQYIKCIARGKIVPGQFKEKPARTFRRITPITEGELHEDQVIIAPDVLFLCNEDDVQYSFQEIEIMADGEMIFCSLPPEPQLAGVETIQLWGQSEEDQIKKILINHL